MLQANTTLPVSYDYLQVALSALIAVSGSYAALDLAGRVTAAKGWPRFAWFTGGAVAMGIGIWSMHFTAMLAFRLPIPVAYHWPTVVRVLLIGVLSSAFALQVASRDKMGWARAVTSGLILGAGIAALHYVGMTAMRLGAVMEFNHATVALSVVFAIVFSLAALLFAFDLREVTRGTPFRKLVSSLAMGAAISVMHYTGMASARFVASNKPVDFTRSVSISDLGALGIGAVTLMLLGLTVFLSFLSRQQDARAQDLERAVLQRTSQLTALNEDLSASEERFRRLVDALPDAIIVHSNDRIVFVNPFGIRLLGAQNAQQIIGKNISEIIHPDYGATIKNRILRNYETGAGSPAMESTIISLDGSTVDIEATAIPITWEGSRAIEVVIRDARERKKVEQTAQEWQRRMELAERAGLSIGLWDWDLNTNKVVWSEEAYRQFGLTKETFSGRVEDAVAWIHPGDRATVEEAIRRVLAGGREYSSQYRVVRPDGTICWIDAYGVVAREGPPRMLGIGIDITNLKKTEQSLKESKIEMAHMVRIAIAGELTASIAHEINQPLTAVVTDVSASLRWLGQHPPNLEEARTALTMAIREANRASDVIGRIRALLRKTPPPMRQLDVGEVVDDVLALAREELVTHGVTVTCEFAADVPRVLGDRIQLQQLFLNLIMNAIDAMGSVTDRSRRLLIKSSRHPEGVLVQVHDSGEGVSPEQADQIFEPFFTTKAQGIGMGLAISHSIVEAHGGRLWVSSGSPHGAIFQFTLQKSEGRYD
jgi:PAS domain S-box-containing protein